jgi:deazaflavin-dependent oxidoreductase (nitroreductase family)
MRGLQSRFQKQALSRAGHLGSLARVDHIGRRTGRERHTPVRAYRNGPVVAVGVNFGVESQWVQNVLVAGSCRMELRGRALRLGECRLVPLAETRDIFPWWFWAGLRWLVRTEYCLVMTVLDDSPV